MRNLLRFIIKYHLLILFLGIESFSFYLLFQNNHFHRSKFADFTRNIEGSYRKKSTNIKDYLALRKMNQHLTQENETLRNQLECIKIAGDIIDPSPASSKIYNNYISARIVNNSTNKQHNFITLDKGRADSIKPEMGVISTYGIVGIVEGVSEHYSTVMSILNRDTRISAKIKKNDYYGSLEWTGKDYRQALLKEIPHHVDIVKGDTIVTSGFSSIFPEGILIGFVEDYKLVGGNFFQIRVNLSTNFKNLTHVYVFDNQTKDEQKKLEELTISNEL